MAYTHMKAFVERLHICKSSLSFENYPPVNCFVNSTYDHANSHRSTSNSTSCSIYKRICKVRSAFVLTMIKGTAGCCCYLNSPTDILLAPVRQNMRLVITLGGVRVPPLRLPSSNESCKANANCSSSVKSAFPVLPAAFTPLLPAELVLELAFPPLRSASRFKAAAPIALVDVCLDLPSAGLSLLDLPCVEHL